MLSPRVSDGPRCCYMDGHVILNTQGVLDSVVAPAKGIRTGCPDAPSDGFVSHGEREIYKSVGLLLGIKRLPGIPFLLRAKAYIYSFRGTVPLINGEEIFSVVMMTIGVSRSISSYEWLSETMVMGCGPWLLVVIAYYPDVYALPASFALPWIGEAETSFCFGFVVRNGSKKDCFICRVSEASEKAIDKLNAKEFRERFCIPHDVLIDLVNEEAAMPTEKGGKNVPLHKGTIQRGAPVPSAGVVQGIPPLLSDSPIFIHPNLVRVLMGCSIINMLYSLDLTLLEVFFVYSLKKAKNDIFSVSAHLPSLQMVTELPDSTKGGAKGLVAVWGGWAGLSQHPSRPFSPNYTLKIPGLELRGHLVDWVEKASFACVCKLFEIDPKERAYKTLLPRNLTEVVREPQEYVINILPRKLAKDEIVPGEHYTVKELPLYQEAKEADAERRRKLLEDRDQKKLKALSGRLPDRSGEPTPPKEFPPPQTTYEGEVMIEEPVNAAPHSISSGPGRMSGLNHQLKRPRWRKRGQKAKVSLPTTRIAGHSPGERASLKKPRLTRDLQSGLFERLQERQQEIEISCASAHDAHPDGGEIWGSDSGTRVPSASSSEEESADDAAPASPFSYAELEAKLKQITPDWKAIKPSAKMFDMIETLVRGLRSMSQQHDLFTQLLQTADYMRTFSSRRQEIENQLRLRMEEAEASLSTMREENEALRGSWLRRRVEKNQLRAAYMRRRELEREFAVEREELAADYQQQVDDTFIFGYRCCMKKNGISEIPLQFLRVKKRSSMRSPLPDSLSLFAIFLL
ncbi:hypothetical protein CK203_101700 [Vitis vinifera]|uniref:Uncharacterized protein n=1 Tax=Vitis vinifera TaxID=29760 RepID=A0A438FH13_VITVI|nr:hypothetical protein CK203_101700 [Vitis vinifera]